MCKCVPADCSTPTPLWQSRNKTKNYKLQQNYTIFFLNILSSKTIKTYLYQYKRVHFLVYCFKNEIELWCHRHMSWLLMARWVGFYQQVSEATLNRSSVSLVFATLHGVIFGIWFRNKPNWRGSWSWRTHTHTRRITPRQSRCHVWDIHGFHHLRQETVHRSPCCVLRVDAVRACVRLSLSLTRTHGMGVWDFFSFFFLLPVPIYIFLCKSH